MCKTNTNVQLDDLVAVAKKYKSHSKFKQKLCKDSIRTKSAILYVVGIFCLVFAAISIWVLIDGWFNNCAEKNNDIMQLTDTALAAANITALVVCTVTFIPFAIISGYTGIDVLVLSCKFETVSVALNELDMAVTDEQIQAAATKLKGVAGCVNNLLDSYDKYDDTPQATD